MHADNPSNVVPHRVDATEEHAIDLGERFDAGFPIITACIPDGTDGICQHNRRERHTVFGDVPDVLRGVKIDVHDRTIRNSRIPVNRPKCYSAEIVLIFQNLEKQPYRRYFQTYS
jgi:hypothetical protein